MPIAYEIGPDDNGWGRKNTSDVEAVHARKVPGVRCPSCGIWSTTGIIYPSANLPLLDSQVELRSPWPVLLEEFRTIASKIEAILGPNRPVEPGTDLGPLRGKAKGRLGDFAWVNQWTPLVRASVFQNLNDAGIHLLGIPAQLDFGKDPREILIELEALPIARLRMAFVPTACEICGRFPLTRPDKLVIDTSSYDDSIPLQRILDLPTTLVVNDDFARFITAYRLRDVILTPIDLT